MKNEQNNLVISYMTLRKYVGILGIALPFVVMIGSFIFAECDEVHRSVSIYYHTVMRNVFVGILCAVAFFLFAYNGHDKRDTVLAKLASLFAIGVAFFPTTVDYPLPTCIIEPSNYQDLYGIIHLICAAAFFSILVLFSVWLFPKTDKVKPGIAKLRRNVIFKICGYTILGSILLIGLYKLVLESRFPILADYDPIYWFETVALIAFGISWLTKGQLFFKDKIENPKI